ncbi:Carboxypeptidase Q [Varanus komodoensis]|nr:Carboxypeptidase Q [Varanus komodoensis]
MQSDQPAVKPGPAHAPSAKHRATASSTVVQRPASALGKSGQRPSPTPPMSQPHPSDNGNSPSRAQQPLSPPRKQREKRKHGGSDQSSAHKKATKDKAAKLPHKKRHRDLGSTAPSIPVAASVPKPSPYLLGPDSDSDADSTSPDGLIMSQGPSSPEEPHISFGELMSRLVQLLEIEEQHQPDPSTDKFYDIVRGEQLPAIVLPLTTTLQQAMTQPWDLLSQIQPTVRRYESMYQVRESDIPFLLHHPKPNSVVVESSQGREARGHTAPRDKEGRKIDTLARRVYAAAGLGLHMSNYEATLARYQFFIMQRLNNIVTPLPEQQRDLVRTFIKEGMQVAIQQLSTARRHVDTDSRALVGAASLRRHAWLRNCNFPDEMKRRIEEMPFDGSRLFHSHTVHKLKSIRESRMTPRRMELPGQLKRRNKVHRSSPPIHGHLGVLYPERYSPFGGPSGRTDNEEADTLSRHMLASKIRVEKKMKLLFSVVFICLFPQSKEIPLSNNNAGHQRTFEDIKKEIAGYAEIAKKIINLAVYGAAQNRSYERLSLFVDTIGPRLSGSRNLEQAIQYMYQALKTDGLENVHLEPVKIPHWERGEESAMIVEPYNHNMAILGLGSSIATPPEGITAEVLVVSSFDELHRKAQEARGKIVVYNQRYISYGETVLYRSRGAVEAAKVGAKASLIKSITPFSINR